MTCVDPAAAARAQGVIAARGVSHWFGEGEHRHRVLTDLDLEIERGEIVVLDTPEALKASVGADRVVVGTADDEAALAALRDRFGIEATTAEGAVTFHVDAGEAFVPRLFAELGVEITTVTVARPTLDDVFLALTGHPADRPTDDDEIHNEHQKESAGV